jgi:polysaccharide deacetylase 2 family uncharacterized protein YibQ
VPTRRKPRRRKRSPAFALLFLVGFGCCAAALAIWLWSPDRPPDTAATPPTAPPDILPRRTVLAPETAPPAEPSIAAATVAPTTPSPAESVTALPSAPAERATLEPAARPRLAIIIDDCGQWPVTERAFVALPFPLTLSVLPHVRFGSTIARDANAAGKGVMLHLPMQTISGRYPGPGTITTAMADDAIRNEVAGDLAELPEARGVNNHEGSLATQDARVMGDIADVLARGGRFFIDSRTSSASVGESVARERGVLSASRSVFLDNVDSQPAIEARLLEAIADARSNGSAIAIGHPRPATLAAVRNVGPRAAADGVELTLASALVH